MPTLGKRLKRARERKNFSQVEVFKRTGINNKTLSRYESDGTEPDIQTLNRLAELYQVSVDWLSGRITDPNISSSHDLLSKYNIGENIAKLRNKLNLTQQEFAENLKVPKEAVFRWETNQSMPSISSLAAISELAGVSVNEILTDGKPIVLNGVELPNELQDEINEMVQDILKANNIKEAKRLVSILRSVVRSFNG